MSVWFRQICIRVADLDRSIGFYETLGFSVTSLNRINETLTEAILENPERGGWLQLAQDTAIPTPINRGDAVFKIYVYTDDCRKHWHAAIAAGHASTQPPMELDRWPYTVAYLTDPDGYTVELVQNTGDDAGRDCGFP